MANIPFVTANEVHTWLRELAKQYEGDVLRACWASKLRQCAEQFCPGELPLRQEACRVAFLRRSISARQRMCERVIWKDHDHD